MQTRITVNGVEYSSIDQMPPDVRRQYERAMGMLADKDGNGVPDILEGHKESTAEFSGSDHPGMESTVVTSSSIVVNGKQYARWEDVPPEIRRLLQNSGVSDRADGSSTSMRNTTFDVALSASGARHLRRGADAPDNAGGIMIRLSWSVLLALISAIAVTAVLAWWMMK